MPPGEIIQGFRNEDISSMTFADNSIDLHITQDVLEHVFHVDKAFSEISRTLKPGGMHICTVPLVSGVNPTKQRAEILPSGEINHLMEPDYHKNPISEDGSLVVWEWGYDIIERIYNASKMPTICLNINDLSKGIRAEYVDVLVSIKR